MASSASVRDKYLCHICEKTFESKKTCMEHTKSHYQQQYQASAKPQSSKDGGSAEPNIPTSTTAEKDSKSDVSQHTDGVPSLKNFSDEEILAKLLERNYAFVCKCGIIFLDQALFYLHRRTHSAKNPYECSFCGHVAPNWYDFMSHFYVHSKDK